MSQQNIDFGTFPDDPSADAIRTAFNKVQNNFDQLFGANANTTVTSINRTPGAGITVNYPTGNVVVSANLACLQVSTSSLKMGRGGNNSSNALITQSSQTLVIDINPDQVYSNYFADVNNGLSVFNGNLSVNSNYQANLTSFGNLTSLNVAGRANFTGSNTYISSVSNLHIPGGGAGYTIVTDGAGNLSWSAVTTGSGSPGGNAAEVQFQGSGGNLGLFEGNSGFTFTTANGLLQTPLLTVAGNTISANFIGTLANGNSNISITNNSNITFTAISNSTMVVSDTGANITGTANVSGNANVGNLGADQGIFTTSANIPLIQNGNSNVTIGANTTVSIFVAGNTTARIAATSTGANISGIANVTGNIVTAGNISTTGGNGRVQANNFNITGAATGNANVSTITGNLGIRALASTYTDNVALASATITNGAIHAIAQPTLTASNASVTFTNAATLYIANSPANSGTTLITNPYSLYIANGSTYFGGANNYMAGNLIVAGNTTYYNVDSFNVEDPIISLGGGVNGAPLTSNDGKDRGSALQYYTTTPVTAFMGWDNSNSEFAFGSNVSISSDVVTYNNLGNARGLSWLGNVDGTYANLSGDLTSANANLGNSAIANYFVGRLHGAANSIANGTSNIDISTTNGNVTIGVAGNANIMTVTGTGVNVAGTLNTGTGNANVGNLSTSTAIITTGNITTINSSLLQNGNSNVSITANANIAIAVTGANRLVVTSTGANITGTANVTGNITTASNVISTGGYIKSASYLWGNGSGTGSSTAGLILDYTGVVQWQIYPVTTAARLAFYSGGSEWVSIANTGNVGISNTNPTNTLSVTGTAYVSGNANVGNLGTAQVLASANVTSPQFISNIATATGAPFSVQSTNRVANLSVAYANVSDYSVVTRQSTGTWNPIFVSASTSGNYALASNSLISANLANGALIATTFVGNITGNIGGILANGNSNVSIPSSNGNVNITAAGVTTLIVTGTGVNIAGTLNTANIIANTITGNNSTGGLTITGEIGIAGDFEIGGNIEVLGGNGNATGNTIGGPVRIAGGFASANGIGGYAELIGGTSGGLGASVRASGGGGTSGGGEGGNLVMNAGTGVGTDKAGGTTVIAGGKGSGAGAPGNIAIQVSTALTTGTTTQTLSNIAVFTSTGANITGTANISGNANVNNLGTTRILASGNITTTQLISNIAVGTAPLVVTSTTQVANLNVATAGSATNAAALLQNTSTSTTVYPTFTTSSANGNSSAVINTSISANLGNASITATTFVGALSGAATTAGTVTTNAQPNINSVGTLTGLLVGNATANSTFGNGTIYVGTTSTIATGVVTIASNSATTNQLALADTRAYNANPLPDLEFAIQYNAAGAYRSAAYIRGGKENGTDGNSASYLSFATNGNTAGLASSERMRIDSSGNVGIANIAPTNTLSVTGTAYVSGNANIGNLGTAQVLASANVTSPQLISNIAVGTAPLVVTSTTRVANLNVAYANVSDFGAITAQTTGTYYPVIISAGTTGNYAHAVGPTGISYNLATNTVTATTFTGNLSGNVTATGTVQAANITATAYITRAVTNSVSANGTGPTGNTQANATALTTEINIVSAVAAGTGVRLPAAVAGTVVYITNNTANSLLVYPQTNGIINNQAANAAFTQGANATLQYMAPTTTQWYTIGATYA